MLQRWWLHVNEVGLQLVSPHRLDGLRMHVRMCAHVRAHTHTHVLASVIFRFSLPCNRSQKGLPSQHLCCAYVWLDVNDANLPAAQNILHRLDAGAVQIPFVLTIFQKPVESQLTLILNQDEI